MWLCLGCDYFITGKLITGTLLLVVIAGIQLVGPASPLLLIGNSVFVSVYSIFWPLFLGRVVCVQCADVACCYRFARSMVCVSVCLSVCVWRTGELYKNVWTNQDAIWQQTSLSPRNRIFDGEADPPGGRGTSDGDVSAHSNVPTRTAHCLPAATGKCVCLAHSGRMHSPPWGWQDGDAAFCQITVDSC